MTADIVQLQPNSYEAAMRLFRRHYEDECDDCTEKQLCPRGTTLAGLAWSLMAGAHEPRRMAPDGRRRRSS